MAETQAPPVIQTIDIQNAPLILPTEAMDEQYALSLVTKTFDQIEAFRRNNHDTRWQTAEMMYFGNVEKKLWEGTDVPRASMAMPLVFDQVEAATPLIMQALFGDVDWFDVEAVDTEDPEVVKKVRDIKAHLKYICENAPDDFDVSPLAQFEYVIKNMLTYGNGVVSLEYDFDAKRPVPCWVDLRNIYFDPGAPTPCMEAAKCLIHRKLLTVDDLYALRTAPGMNIPAKAILRYLAENRVVSASDVALQTAESLRRIQYMPGYTDLLPLPTDQQIEVLQYWSKSRVIWVLNRQWVAYNEKNAYGFIPYCTAPCFTVTGRMYAMGYPDVMGDQQLYAQSLRNLRLDELSLAVNPPRVRQRGSDIRVADLRWRPGMLAEFDDPPKDMTVHLPNGASAGVSDEIAQIVLDAEKRTGVNAMSSGIPTPSNANRTLGGMQMQTQGSSSRLSPIVRHVEDFIIKPMLMKMYRMIQIHGTEEPEQQLPVGEGQSVPQESFAAPVRFTVNAASKMMSRGQLGQILPMVTQYLSQGPLLQALQSTGKTVDWEELLNMLQDATGVRTRYTLVREMSEEEKQATQQPDPQTQAMMQKAQMDQQTRMQMGQMKSETEKQKVQLEYQARSEETDAKDSRELLKFLLEIIANQNDNTREKIQAELAAKVQEMNMKQQQHGMDMFMKQRTHEQSMQHEGQKAQMQMALEGQRVQMDAANEQRRADMDMAVNSQRAQSEMEIADAQRRQDLMFSGASSAQNLQHKESQNQLMLEQKKALAKLGGGKTPRDTGARTARAKMRGKA
jgi:hypothetical protein